MDVVVVLSRFEPRTVQSVS